MKCGVTLLARHWGCSAWDLILIHLSATEALSPLAGKYAVLSLSGIAGDDEYHPIPSGRSADVLLGRLTIVVSVAKLICSSLATSASLFFRTG